MTKDKDANASAFKKIIQDSRDRKKSQDVAAAIFGRRSSASLKKTGSSVLTSHAGINKRQASKNFRASLDSIPKSQSDKGIDGEWTHDLHISHCGNGSRTPQGPRGAARGNSLAARVTRPVPGQGAGVPGAPTGPAALGGAQRQKQRTAQLTRALERTAQHQPSQPSGTNGANKGSTAGASRGMTIKGLAGPYVVLAQNFAPGTTAADIESAMTPVAGGVIQECRIVKTRPIVIAEITFGEKACADCIIDTFNGQTADGRVLQVFYKINDSKTASHRASPPENGAGNSTHGRGGDDGIVDGTMGFEDPMDMDDSYTSFSTTRPARRADGLYSDSMVQANRRDERNYGRRAGGWNGRR